MSNLSYKQQIENTKAQIRYLESLTPEERRAAIINMRKGHRGSEIFSLIMFSVLGLSMLGVTIYSWVIEYNMSLMSSLGVAGGVILNVVGFLYFQPNREESANKVLSDDFTDEDILAYLRERERREQKGYEQWNKRDKYLAILFLAAVLSLGFISSTREFAVTLFNSGLSLFSIGFVVVAFIQYRNQSNRHGS